MQYPFFFQLIFTKVSIFDKAIDRRPDSEIKRYLSSVSPV